MFPAIADLAIIGDRRTAAVIGRDATVYWYGPHRFDAPSIFMALLDDTKGAWRIALPGATPASRAYVANSAVLETHLATGSGELVVTDWLTMGRMARPGLFCRQLSRAPEDTTISFEAWNDYGRTRKLPSLVDGTAVFEDGLHLFASHPLQTTSIGVTWVLPKGEAGWTILADAPCRRPTEEDLAAWRQTTLARWDELAATTTFDGPYREGVEASLRQVRLLVFEPTGAVVAAATTGLPEVTGGKRNYDYRFAWLRDTSMVVRGLLRTAVRSKEGESFLQFVADTRRQASQQPLDVVVTVDGRPTPSEEKPLLAGYESSRPVRIGNRAGRQLQLGSLGDVLIAAAEIYRKNGERSHWEIVRRVADFLVGHWHKPDAGIWESPTSRQYTASKVFAACGLEKIAPFADDERQACYRACAKAIRAYVQRNCITREGAYAAYSGFDGVDISAALFAVWDYCPADSPEMEASLHVLHRDYEKDGLFRREDETSESRREGAFLPGTFWVSQYWMKRGDGERARFYLEAGLKQANDLGIFPEEIEWRSGRALGNFPLAMAHASFLNAAHDFAVASQS